MFHQILFWLVFLDVFVFVALMYKQLFQYLTMKKVASEPIEEEATVLSTLPSILVQIPVKNSSAINAINSACNLLWGREISIQVLENSDGFFAVEYTRQLVDKWKNQGKRISLVRREPNLDSKVAVLNYGMEVDRQNSQYIAILDVDFQPDSWWLLDTYSNFKHLDRGGMGCVQTRWTYRNQNKSLLTRTAALQLAGHFMIEKMVRLSTTGTTNFNGSAAIFKRRCIQECGGWRSDTLTEDADISTRAYKVGWGFYYAQDVTCSSELPESYRVFRRQQMRWCTGASQVGKGRGIFSPYTFWFHLYFGRLSLFLMSVCFGHYVLGVLFSIPYLVELPYYLIAGYKEGSFSKKDLFLLTFSLPLTGLYLLVPCAWSVLMGILPGKRKFVVTSKVGA